MSFKKYDGSIWQPITPKQLKGIPYTGTLPATLTGTKAGYLHRYKIYGNTEQTGTPTPENPIMPSECGERTSNLLDFNALKNAPAGTITEYNFPHVLELQLKPNTAYTMVSNGTGSETATPAGKYRSVYFNSSVASSTVFNNHPVTVTTDSTGAVKIGIFTDRTNAQQYLDGTAQVWLVEGSTALPYIPYGYKLPLTSAGQDVNIYIGDEPLRKIGNYADYIDYGTGKIVRQVKKLVLDGTENWQKSQTYGGSFLLRNTMDDSTLAASPLSNFLLYSAQASYTSGSFTITGTQKTLNVWFPQFDAQTTVERFKAYLAEQYAAGTPMTIWYVLTTPVEEDPPSPFSQIPTSAGSTTISWAGSGLAPSEFDSIQEWVDIPTYTYTNGEWVADNSN